MIVLEKTQFDEILMHCINAMPNEACGLLGGRVEGDLRIVGKVYLLSNMDNSPEHFSMNPKEQFNAIKDIRANGWTMFGNFHSHPASPSRPSEEDIRLAFDPEASYLILSLSDKNKPVLKSFRIHGGEAEEEAIKLRNTRLK